MQDFPLHKTDLIQEIKLKMTQQPLHELFEAMYHGKISFHDFMHSAMPQNYEVINPGSGGQRRILKPKESLRTYHKFLNLFLFEFLPINERVVFSYRKGFSAVNAVEKHKQGKYFFQTDISSFFGSIDRSLTKSTILAGAKNSPISDVTQHIDRIVDLVCIDDSLPIGFPASAPLSNSVLFNFDNKLEEICQSSQLTYSRYADDIIISGQTQEDILKIEELIPEKLHEFASNKFNINKGKTRLFQAGGRVKILGIMILPNGKISPDTKKKKELEVLLHFHATNKEKFNQVIAQVRKKSKKPLEASEDENLDILSGNLNYVNSIDPDYINKLRRKFGAATIDMLMHKGFSNKS